MPPKRRMKSNLASIQIGRVISEGNAESRDVLERHWTTGFYKTPLTGPVSVTTLGLAGDSVADTRNHGGVDKAILCYSAAHYEAWAREHPELNMLPGGLGENLTIAGADESTVCIGDRFRINDCEVEVSQPRQPCWKIARRWGVKSLTKEVTQSGRTGWYLRVITEGTIQAGQEFERIGNPNPQWTVARANDILFGRESDRIAVFELMNLKQLAEAWRADIA